tara:strand:- start:3673 stop:4131 length:459 start_codon:yes stop_codon:yes gene_type:complete
MSQLLESILYIELTEEQIKGISDDNNINNNGIYDYAILFAKDDEIINIENKYPFLYKNTHRQEKCGMYKTYAPYYEFYYIGKNYEIVIDCLESLNIDQLLDDQVTEIQVSVTGANGYKYKETIFKYDYDNEEWLREPLMYDTDMKYIKGSVN